MNLKRYSISVGPWIYIFGLRISTEIDEILAMSAFDANRIAELKYKNRIWTIEQIL
jgi:hypothetical protein